jgi:hypothetical protein
MIRYLLKHQWLQFRRSASFERELGLTIFIWILGLFLLSSIITLSLALPHLLTEQIPQAAEAPITFFCKLLVYYFFAELFLRYFMQKVPVLDIEPYLNLPIKRSSIAKFLLGKSLLSPLNLISLILTIPFALQIIQPEYGGTKTFMWLLFIFLTSIFLHFFNILFKKKLEDVAWVWAIIIALVGGNYLLSIYTDFDLLSPVAGGLEAVLSYPSIITLPIGATVLMAVINYKFFTTNLYLEEIGTKTDSNSERYSEKLSFLGNYGLSGTLILEELRMIIRHKRTRSVIFLSLIFVGYGLIFFGNDNYKGTPGFFVFLGIFMSGLFAINYGQFLWSWNTNQMDFFFTKPLAMDTWIKSRYQLVLASVVISSILAIPYVYFGWEALAVVLTGSFYNAGVNIPLMMRLSLWGPKPIDLNKGAFMNYQGTGAAQWLMGLPLFLGPFVFYTPVYYLAGHMAGLGAVAAAGIIGLSLRDYFIRQIAKALQNKKYKLIHDLTL